MKISLTISGIFHIQIYTCQIQTSVQAGQVYFSENGGMIGCQITTRQSISEMHSVGLGNLLKNQSSEKLTSGSRDLYLDNNDNIHKELMTIIMQAAPMQETFLIYVSYYKSLTHSLPRQPGQKNNIDKH